MLVQQLRTKLNRHRMGSHYQSLWQVLHLDPWLLLAVGLVIFAGFLILYSAGNGDMSLVKNQAIHIGVGAVIMILLAQIPPTAFKRHAIFLYLFTLFLLFAVLIMGHIGKGADRWLGAGPVRFQPSELAQIVIPLAIAWYYDHGNLPPSNTSLLFCSIVIILPCLFIAKEPDLGTAIVTGIAGFTILLLAGLRWRWLVLGLIVLALLAPIAWHFLMHPYQKERIIIFLDPEKSPLGAGYHIIQSKIAIGSGGFFGQGWLNASQSKLHFLPENTTDFIFSVCAQEFGFFGCLILILLFLLVTFRGLYIAMNAQDSFTRLLAGSLSLTFFMSCFVNIGMVSGILPVVGVPLPLISYGGTSMVSIMASFGVLMSIQTHRKLINT